MTKKQLTDLTFILIIFIFIIIFTIIIIIIIKIKSAIRKLEQRILKQLFLY